MVEYDPKIIQKFADRLYSQARSVFVIYSLLGGIVGAFIFYIINYFLHHVLLNAFYGFLFGVVLGLLYAAEKAFELKLKAQTALCNLKIEENTRNSNSPTEYKVK